jgi:hypothetical protein
MRVQYDRPASRPAPTMATGKKMRIRIQVKALPRRSFKRDTATDETTPLVRPPLRPKAVEVTTEP